MKKKIIWCIAGIVIGISIVILILVINFYREKVWVKTDSPVKIQRIGE